MVGGDRRTGFSRRRQYGVLLSYVVAIAGGRTKLEAVRGAVAGRFMNVLVTDEDVAAALLRRGA